MTDVVWSVNIMLGVGLVGVAYIIYYILKMANDELNVPVQDKEDKENH